MALPFEVHPYSIAQLRGLLATIAKADADLIAKKTHLVYFQSYFGKIGAKTIVAENEYVDRDFLEDYAAYYVRCFHTYDRKCTRLHFFDTAFTTTDFDKLLRGESGILDPTLLKNSYLGFVVVKPLPETVIGRTCLKTYDDGQGRRCYPITRPYESNLFGIDLPVDSLAYQEQDSVVAACATSALWSAFHGTGILFQHAIPSPVEITKAASTNFASESRNLPNHGLTIEQMALAIRSVGLEPFVVGASDDFIFKSTLYAYLRGRVPVLMIGWLVDITGGNSVSMGKHAVAVTGFGCTNGHAGIGGPGGFLSKCCFIDRIYAHDDQVGPFARMLLDGTTVNFGTVAQPQNMMSLSTSWKGAAGTVGHVRFVPDTLLVPLYHKIRIPFARVQEAVMPFDAFIEMLRQHAGLPLKERLKWDVYLTTVSDFKRELTKTNNLAPDLRKALLCMSLPRFVWRAIALCDGQHVVDLLFDGTDIEQGKYFVQAIKYDSIVAAFLKAFLGAPGIDSLLNSLQPAPRMILDQFR
jgi:hypothetical protein